MRRISNIIVAFSKAEDARNIKNILVRHGFSVAAVCGSGAQVIASLDEYHEGIIVSGYRFADMVYQGICDCMPENFEMLLLASQAHLGEEALPGVMQLSLPLRVHDLLDTLGMMEENQERKRKRLRRQPPKRSDRQRQLIQQAKQLLMERNHMEEEEAYRYIQKCSMDSGTNMVETAQMVMSLIDL